MLVISFLLYLLLLVITAKLLSSRMTGLVDFFLAGRKLPGLAITLTFVASWFGAGSTIGSMNSAYQNGLSALWLIAIPSILSCLIVTFCFARPVRNLNSLSQPEAIEERYGPFGSLLLAWIILASITTFIASQLVAAGHLLEATMGLSPVLSIALILGAVILYSVIGGFRAVVMTDVLQFISFTLGIVVLLGFVLMTPEVPHASSVTNPSFWNPLLDLKHHLAMVFTFVLAWSIAPEMWQRMSSSRNANEAQKSALAAGLILAVLYAMVIATGMLAIHHLPANDAFAQKNVLIALAMALPMPILTAVVLIGVLSAITSTIDSSLNVGCLTFTRDIVHRHLWPSASQTQLIRLSQITTVLIGLPATVIALYYQDIIQILWISADIYASTMFIPILGLFYLRDCGRWSGILAMVMGAIPVVLNFLKDFEILSLPSWWPAWPYTTLMGLSFSVIGFGIGLMLYKVAQRQSDESIFEAEPV